MPSVIAHGLLGAATGWALPRRLLPGAAVAVGAVCAALPDLDVIGLYFGVPYHHWLGHRGFTHSPAFALLLAGVIVAAWSPRRGFSGSRPALFLYLFGCTASHGLLDAMTNGGLGVALLAPLSNQRSFLPWRPIAVAPLDPRRLLGPWGLRVLASEALCIGVPLLVIAGVRLARGWHLRRGRAAGRRDAGGPAPPGWGAGRAGTRRDEHE